MEIEVTILLRKVRKARGFTLVQLAHISGVSKSYISQIERGKQMPSIYVLCQIATALEVKVDELYTYKVK